MKGFSGTWRSTSSVSVPTCRFSMLQCHRWEPVVGGLQALGHHVARASYRRAKDLARQNPAALGGL